MTKYEKLNKLLEHSEHLLAKTTLCKTDNNLYNSIKTIINVVELIVDDIENKATD